MIGYIGKIINSAFSGAFIPLSPVNLLELSVIAICFFVFYKKYIQGTNYERLLKGIMMLVLALLMSKLLILLKLQILGKFLESLVSIVIFGLLVVFQPELRRFLGFLGQPGFLSRNIFANETVMGTENSVAELAESIKYLSKSRTGALMVIQKSPDMANYFEVGTKLNAHISTELLLTIFHPNTALHDGAVVIYGNTVVSAGVLLPLTEDPKLSWQYGTRHRAAIGMSEASDASCIVVSEETGSVSITKAGHLTKIESPEALLVELKQLFGQNKHDEKKQKTSKEFNLNNSFLNDLAALQDSPSKNSEK